MDFHYLSHLNNKENCLLSSDIWTLNIWYRSNQWQYLIVKATKECHKKMLKLRYLWLVSTHLKCRGAYSATIFGTVTVKCESLIGNLTLFAVVVLLGSGTLERVTPDTRLSGYVSTSRQSSILPQSLACSSSHFFIQDLSYTRYFVLRHTTLLGWQILD